MRVSFSSMTTASAARSVLEAYGYSATQFGRDVVTDCPTLLAIPAIQKGVGLAAVEHLDLTGGTAAEADTSELGAFGGSLRRGGVNGMQPPP